MDLIRHRWRILMSAALAAPLVAFGAAAPAQAATTQVTVTAIMSDGVTPMANAEVDVFYMPPNPPRQLQRTADGVGNDG